MMISQIHLIVLCLFLFLVGVAVLFYLLRPTLVASVKERTLPRILTRLAALLALWISVYFASVLLRYYHVIIFPVYYTTILAVAAAAIPWLGLYWRWQWSEQLNDEARKDSK